MMLHVLTGEDHVTIADTDGYEVAHWTQDEWEEDPTLVPTIVDAAVRARREPIKVIEDLYGSRDDWDVARAKRNAVWSDEVQDVLS